VQAQQLQCTLTKETPIHNPCEQIAAVRLSSGSCVPAYTLGRTGLGRTKVQQGLVYGGLASKALRLSSTKGGLGRRDQGWAVRYPTRLGRPRPRKLGRQSLAATAHLRLASKPWLARLAINNSARTWCLRLDDVSQALWPRLGCRHTLQWQQFGIGASAAAAASAVCFNMLFLQCAVAQLAHCCTCCSTCCSQLYTLVRCRHSKLTPAQHTHPT
jgi:hypothetical protein